MLVNQSALNGITVGFKTIFNKVFSETKPEWQKVATYVQSATGEEDYKWLNKFGAIREWVGERVVQNLQASSYTVKNKDFEKTVGVDRNDIEDDKIGVYSPVITDLAQSASMLPDKLVFGLLRKGFTEKCFDGLSFFNTTHKVGKNTASNLGDKALSIESYSEARSIMMSYQDENGESLDIIPNLLVVPPALESKAREILKADQINGTTNIFKDTAEILVSTQLAGDNTKWYLLCTTKAVKPFIYQERKKPEFVSLTKSDDTNVFMNKQFLYGVDMRCNVGFSFWQMAYGSTGTK